MKTMNWMREGLGDLRSEDEERTQTTTDNRINGGGSTHTHKTRGGKVLIATKRQY